MVNTAQIKDRYPISNLQEIVDSLTSKLATAHQTGLNSSQLSADLNYNSKLLKAFKALHTLLSDHDQHCEIINSGEDVDLVKMANDELPEIEQKIEEKIEEIKQIEIDHELTDVNDSRSAILEIRAGAGGDEAAIFASDLYRMYVAYANQQDWKIEMIDASLSESGGFKEVVALIKGEDVYQKLKYESGVHRVQRIPTTESSGRIHTSTVSVAILPEAQEIDIDIKPEDIHIETMRASGAGGQKTNKTSSAIRITHLPSGIVVSCQETKIQQQNREKAMQILRARLYDKKRQEEADKRDSLRNAQIGNAMRAEKIRTYNYPQSRITDHRIKSSWHNLEEIMNGSISEMLTEIDEKMKVDLLEKIRKEKLKDDANRSE